MLDIAMLSCNRKRITETAIREIKVRTTYPHRLIVMDNGSEDGTEYMLPKLRDEGLIDLLILSEENLGVHMGFNTLLDEVKSKPYYVCTDSDLIPHVPVGDDDWLTRLIDLMSRHPDYGAIACRPHILIGEPADRFDDSPEVREMSHIGAHLRIMRTDLIREVGGWKKKISPSRNNEDWYISGKLKKAGCKVGYSRDIRCIHLFGRPGLSEDPWGYPEKMTAEDHGHTERWPPVHHYSWDRMNISWATCEEKGPDEEDEVAIQERLRSLGYVE